MHFLQVSVIHLGLSSSHYDVLKIFHEIADVVVLGSQVVVDIEYNSITATRAGGLTGETGGKVTWSPRTS